MTSKTPHVMVIGAGNAGMCAALAARERGAEVTVLERAPETERGGNTRFTAGAMRVVYEGLDDLRQLMPDLPESQIEKTDFGTYDESDFYEDMARVTEYRCDPDLVELLVTRSFETLGGCLPRACASCPSTGGKRSRWMGASRSGVA